MAVFLVYAQYHLFAALGKGGGDLVAIIQVFWGKINVFYRANVGKLLLYLLVFFCSCCWYGVLMSSQPPHIFCLLGHWICCIQSPVLS